MEARYTYRIGPTFAGRVRRVEVQVGEVIDAEQLWVNARFDQLGAGGLAAGLPTRVSLRSQPLETFAGEVNRGLPVISPAGQRWPISPPAFAWASKSVSAATSIPWSG